jgi:putative serine protease PepD
VTALRAGQTVIAVGSPLGQRAVGSGIISSLHRAVTVGDAVAPTVDRTFSDTIQSSALVDQVSSGGPLLNVAGQVIGVTVAAESNAGQVGFAISVADIRSEVEQIVRDGKLVVPSLGVITHDVTSQDAAGQAVPVGASVTTVIPGGPGEAAGLKAGDLITAVDEVKLDDAHPLLQVLANQFRPTQRVTLTLSRDGVATQVQATLGSRHPVCG